MKPCATRNVLTRRTSADPGRPLVNLKRILWQLLAGTRGGPQRIRILTLLRERPSNANQIAERLGLDYKTVTHHLRVLAENRIVSSTGKDYGAVYLFTPDMEESLAEFEAIAAKLAPGSAADTGRT